MEHIKGIIEAMNSFSPAPLAVISMALLLVLVLASIMALKI